MSGRGFPSPLPAGETLLWRGAPDFRTLARTALHARGLALYFALIVAYCAYSAAGSGPAAMGLATLKAAGAAAVPVGLALAYAWAASRMAVYSITNRRVVMHIGVALPVTLNVPFARIGSADLRAGRDGSGDLCLSLTGRDRFAYVILWPHARPWRFAPAQPTLRGLKDVGKPAQILSRALAASADMAAPVLQNTAPLPAMPEHVTIAA